MFDIKVRGPGRVSVRDWFVIGASADDGMRKLALRGFIRVPWLSLVTYYVFDINGRGLGMGVGSGLVRDWGFVGFFPSGPFWCLLGIFGPLCASLGFHGFLWASLGLSGPLCASLSFCLSGPLCASLGLSEIVSSSLCPSGLFFASLNLSGHL